jgi:hypothetical protein
MWERCLDKRHREEAMVRRSLVLAGLLAGTAVLAFADDLPDPYKNAKAGSWTIEKGVTNVPGKEPRGEFTYRWVSKVDGRNVTVSTQAIKDDLKTGIAPARTMVVDGAKKAEENAAAIRDKKATVTDDEIELKGKKLKCKRVERQAAGGVTIILWVTDEIPVNGVARSVAKNGDKETFRAEVVDWGLEGGAEKPVK